MSHPKLQAEQEYVDRAYEHLERMRATVAGAADRVEGEVAQAAMDAWAARRLRTFEDAERGLCFGRLDFETVSHPLYVGRRWVHDDAQRQLVVNWQAPAARPFYTATPQDPHGVTLRRRFRTDGRRLIDIADEALDGSIVDGAAVGDFLLEELEQNRTAHMRDMEMMRLLDAFMSIPRVLLLIAVLTLWDHVPLAGIIVLIGATGWFTVSRLVRAEVRTIRETDFVVAAQALGAPTGRILWRHLLPNVLAPVIVSATLAVGNVIALEAGLSFLGIGAPPPAASWGAMFTDAVDPFSGAWWVPLFPGIAIVATVLAFNVLGDALRDVLDPRQLHLARPLPVSTVELVPIRQQPEHG